jgi:putative DNA primase/helicase
MTSARDLAAQLNLRRAAGGWIGACPACGYKTGLRLKEKEGRALWWCASCQDQAAVTAAIVGHAPAAPIAAPHVQRDESRRAAAVRLWEQALPAEGSPVAVYLATRGLTWRDGLPLRFLPEAKHPSGRRLPCMLALLTDAEGRPAAVHRTFLAPGGAGKAAVEPQRMTLGNVTGAAVRLSPLSPILAIGEGIETALAAGELLTLPSWAAVSAGNLGATLALPEGVREVIIAADHDRPGGDAARAAAARWQAEGRRVRIATPNQPGDDFNDVLRRRVAHV